MNDSLEAKPPRPKPTGRVLRRRYLVATAVGVAYGLMLRFVFSAMHSSGTISGPMAGASSVMLVSFLFAMPFVVGMLLVYLERASMTVVRAIFVPWLAMLLIELITGLLGFEGSICIVIATPIFLVLSSIGGLIMYSMVRLWAPSQANFSLVLFVPLLLAAGERQLQPPQLDGASERSVHVDAPPAAVWRLINDAQDIRPEEMHDGLAWRIGVPYPLQGITAETAAGRVRKVAWQRGVHFDEPILDWDENRYIRWSYRFAPDSIPAGAMDEHVRPGGPYFDLLDTSYTLQPEGGGTRLAIRVGYRVRTNFNWYAGPLARLFVGDAAESLLHFYKVRGEAAGPVVAVKS